MKRKPASYLKVLGLLRRAEEIGTNAAAREGDVNIATLCRWRRELAETYEAIYFEEEESQDVVVEPEVVPPVLDERTQNILDRLRRRAEEAEACAKEAEHLAHKIIEGQFGGGL